MACWKSVKEKSQINPNVIQTSSYEVTHSVRYTCIVRTSIFTAHVYIIISRSSIVLRTPAASLHYTARSFRGHEARTGFTDPPTGQRYDPSPASHSRTHCQLWPRPHSLLESVWNISGYTYTKRSKTIAHLLHLVQLPANSPSSAPCCPDLTCLFRPVFLLLQECPPAFTVSLLSSASVFLSPASPQSSLALS